MFRSTLFRTSSVSLIQDINRLKQYAETTLRLPAKQAFGSVRQECIQVLNRAFAMAKHDGIVTPEEEQQIIQLQQALHLTPADVAHIQHELDFIRTVQGIRSGKLPVVRPTVTLPSTEVCHWESSAVYYKVLTSRTTLIEGSLVVTDQKVRFVSYAGGFEFPTSKLVSVRYQAPGGVELHLTRKQGNGYYELYRAELLCEILNVLVRRSHRHEVMTQEGSRQIPQHVKLAVWQRDSGHCVQCGATDYLEFDHIIPFSRGGATSVNNIQLLCRRCNLAKSDRI